MNTNGLSKAFNSLPPRCTLASAMAGQSSLTTSRLAALSLSPSRIAQLGVKHDARESNGSGDENASSVREGKKADKAGEGKVFEGERSTGEGKQEGLSVRPELSRRSSTLESLSDEGDGDDEPAQRCAMQQEEARAESVDEAEARLPGAEGIPSIHTEAPRDSTPVLSPPNTAASRPCNNPVSTAQAGSSRDRSPPPSYEHAILPSALEHSSSASTAIGQIARPMSATARGKQRDDGDGIAGDDHDGVTENRRMGGRRGQAMLELLPNSDTDEEDAFSHAQARPSTSTAATASRHPVHDPHQDPTDRSPRTPAIFLPSLGQPSTGRSKHRPRLTKSSRTRSSYTGPVEIIDRSGEGWADSLVEDYDSDSAAGYDVASSRDSLPTRPSMTSSTSSFIRSMPAPSSGAFTQDVKILGWKIVGGRTRKMGPREVAGRPEDAETGEEHGPKEDQQKPRMGAYVGESCVFLGMFITDIPPSV